MATSARGNRSGGAVSSPIDAIDRPPLRFAEIDAQEIRDLHEDGCFWAIRRFHKFVRVEPHFRASNQRIRKWRGGTKGDAIGIIISDRTTLSPRIQRIC